MLYFLHIVYNPTSQDLISELSKINNTLNASVTKSGHILNFNSWCHTYRYISWIANWNWWCTAEVLLIYICVCVDITSGHLQKWNYLNLPIGISTYIYFGLTWLDTAEGDYRLFIVTFKKMQIHIYQNIYPLHHMPIHHTFQLWSQLCTCMYKCLNMSDCLFSNKSWYICGQDTANFSKRETLGLFQYQNFPSSVSGICCGDKTILLSYFLIWWNIISMSFYILILLK